MIKKAEASETAYSFVLMRDELYTMAVTPLLAPDPIAWLCPGFRIDDNFAREIQTYTNLEITFHNQSRDGILFASTLEPNRRQALM